MFKGLSFSAFTLGALIWFATVHDQQKSILVDKSVRTTMQDSILRTGWYRINYNQNGYKRILDKDSVFYFIDPQPLITAKQIKTIKITYTENGKPALWMQLNKNGTKTLNVLTKMTVMSKLAFIVNDKLLYAPTVVSQVTNGMTGLNRGTYTKEELEKFKAVIEKEMIQPK